MIIIPLTQGQVTFIDDEDENLVSRYSWYAWKHRNTYYAATHVRGLNGLQTTVSMHRIIMDAEPGKEIDHRDHDGLNNQRYNLRQCTRQQNGSNQLKQKRKTTSIYKGVSWNKQKRKWTSYIKVSNKTIHLGCSIDEDLAAELYNKAAINYFGEFAQLNEI